MLTLHASKTLLKGTAGFKTNMTPALRTCPWWGRGLQANPGGTWAERTEVGGGECLSQGPLVRGIEVLMSMERQKASIACFLDRELRLQCWEGLCVD